MGKRKILKAAKEKRHIDRRKKVKNDTDFLSETM